MLFRNLKIFALSFLVCGITNFTNANATIVVTLFSGSVFDPNPMVMDATLGVSGLNIEDFEDTTLVTGLSYTLSNPNAGTFTSLPGLFDTNSDPAWANGFWDGSNVVANNSNNNYPNEGIRSETFTFNVSGGTTIFGVGLANFQSLSSPADQFPATNHELMINGNSYGLLESLANWTPGRTVRNGYLLIQASAGDLISSVSFLNQIPGLEILLFDHVAFAPNDRSVPEPATMALVTLGLAGVLRRRRA